MQIYKNCIYSHWNNEHIFGTRYRYVSVFLCVYILTSIKICVCVCVCTCVCVPVSVRVCVRLSVKPEFPEPNVWNSKLKTLFDIKRGYLLHRVMFSFRICLLYHWKGGENRGLNKTKHLLEMPRTFRSNLCCVGLKI